MTPNIDIEPAWNESRPRDIKRKRFVLRVGQKSWHLTPAEVQDLVDSGWNCLELDFARAIKVRKAAARRRRR
jgi:hypothetical protein